MTMLYLTRNSPILLNVQALQGFINWMDVLLVVIVGWAVFRGQRSNIIGEFVMCVGAICAVLVALSFYSELAGHLTAHSPLPASISTISAYFFLFLGTILFFFFLAEGGAILFPIKMAPSLNRWGGLIFSLVRYYFICGLIVLGFYLSENAYLKDKVHRAYTVHLFKNGTMTVYSFLYDRILNRFVPARKPDILKETERSHDG